MKTKKVIESLEKIAVKLGTSSEKIFGFYVKNAKMYRLYFIIESALSLISIISGLIIMFNYVPKTDEWLYINTICVISGGLLCFVGFIGIVITISNISSFINSWVNPEYEAMEDIFGSLFSD